MTAFHSAYFAYELTRRHSVQDSEKLASVLADAQVDLNPHQLDAALFAFKSPLSKGSILADEVGLGKTIEAGLVIAQKWSEGKRRIIIITPANLRKQCEQEMADKFYLPAIILEAKNYRQTQRKGKANPFLQNSLVICSYQFAAKYADILVAMEWDLAVIDEAHRLRNVYKTDNKIAKAIKTALANTPKVLLTATPLQNTLLELYGLVSVIDDYAFGDLKSYRAQYSRLNGDGVFDELKARLAPLCHRTLRRQVLEYIRYTNRIPITEDFFPSDDEIDKLNNWAEDKRRGLKAELKDFDDEIALLKKEARLVLNLPEKLAGQKKIHDLDAKRNTAWKDYDEAAKVIEQQKDSLLDTVEERLKQTIEEKTIFTIEWMLI